MLSSLVRRGFAIGTLSSRLKLIPTPCLSDSPEPSLMPLDSPTPHHLGLKQQTQNAIFCAAPPSPPPHQHLETLHLAVIKHNTLRAARSSHHKPPSHHHPSSSCLPGRVARPPSAPMWQSLTWPTETAIATETPAISALCRRAPAARGLASPRCRGVRPHPPPAAAQPPTPASTST